MRYHLASIMTVKRTKKLIITKKLFVIGNTKYTELLA